MSLSAQWHTGDGETVDVRQYPAIDGQQAFAVLRFLAPSDFFPDFSIQSTSAQALRAIEAAAAAAAEWLEGTAAKHDRAPKPGPAPRPGPPVMTGPRRVPPRLTDLAVAQPRPARQPQQQVMTSTGPRRVPPRLTDLAVAQPRPAHSPDAVRSAVQAVVRAVLLATAAAAVCALGWFCIWVAVEHPRWAPYVAWSLVGGPLAVAFAGVRRGRRR